MAAAFDTLAAAEALEAAGMDPRQAKACAAQLRCVAGANRAEPATRADLAGFEARLFRALWMQAAAIVATLTALAGLAIGLATLVGA